VDSPLVTAIITTYRRPDRLRRAIRSVLNQTMPRLRVCVYDDASGDGTAAVVQSLAAKDSRVEYYCHPVNLGAPANFEYGVQHVATPFFSIMSDDDALLPQFYTLALAQFALYPEAMAAIGETLYMGDDGTYLGGAARRFAPGLHQPPHNLLAMSRYPQPSWTGMLFRAEVRERVGTLDTSLFSMDYDFVLRVAALCPYSVFHDPVALFTVHPEQSTAILRLHMVWPTRYAAIRKMLAMEHIPSDVRRESERILMAGLTDLLFRIALRALLLHHVEECEQTAVLLREVLGVRRHAALLSLAARISRWPGFLGALDWAHAARRKYLARRVKGQVERLDEYFDYYHSLAGAPAGTDSAAEREVRV